MTLWDTLFSSTVRGDLGLWPRVALACFAWTVWVHLDKSTVNYGLSRPGFWVDFLAWYTLCFYVIRMLILGVIFIVTKLLKKRIFMVTLFISAVSLWNFASSFSISGLHYPCCLQMYARGTDLGFLIALRQSIYPFEIAHFSWTKAEFLKRHSNRSFDRWSEKNATDFARQQSNANKCTNTILRNVHRELQHVTPTSLINNDTDGVYLVAAMYCGVKREGAHIELWIDYYLRFGFDYVHLYLDWRDNAWDDTVPYLAQWGDRVRVTKPAETCSQGCAKRLLARTYADTIGWVAWLDADEFMYPLRWSGPLTLRRTLARLREMGYCEIGMNHLSFGDSGYAIQPMSPLESYIYTEVPKWPGYGKAITWMPALSPSDGFQHEGKIRKTIPFCKYLKRASVTQHPNLHLWDLPA